MSKGKRSTSRKTQRALERELFSPPKRRKLKRRSSFVENAERYLGQPCSKCGAGAGEGCFSITGERLTTLVHMERTRT